MVLTDNDYSKNSETPLGSGCPVKTSHAHLGALAFDEDDMGENPSYYATIPASVRYDNELTANAKLLFGEISALSNKHGFCWAGNAYFAKLYGVNTKTISLWVSSLRDRGHVSVEIVKEEGNLRRIRIPILKNVDRSKEESYNPSPEKPEHNTTRVNTTETTTKNRKQFIPPTEQEVVNYFIENGYKVDVAKKAYLHYNVANWHDTKGSPVKNWKQKMVGVWFRDENRSNGTNGHAKPQQPASPTLTEQFLRGQQ